VTASKEVQKNMSDAIKKLHTANHLGLINDNQDIPYMPSGTSFIYEDLPEQQWVILAQI